MSKKMRLISEEEYNLLTQNSSRNPILNSKPDSKQQEILESNIPDDIKSVMLSKEIRALIDVIKKYFNSSADEKVHDNKLEIKEVKKEHILKEDKSTSASILANLNEDDIELIRELPPGSKMSAVFILQTMKNARELISWDTAGVCSFFGKESKATNLSEILSFVLRTSQMLQPKGVEKFMYVAHILNVPLNLFSIRARTVLGKYLKKKHAEGAEVKTDFYDFDAFDEEDEFNTPPSE